jgi:protein-S-isoprenylcysteine O-methyltransferase Ste14
VKNLYSIPESLGKHFVSLPIQGINNEINPHFAYSLLELTISIQKSNFTLPFYYFRMWPTSPDFAGISLAGCFLLAASLTYQCWTPPNPYPKDTAASLPKDTVGNNSSAVQVRRFIFASLWILHIITTFLYPSLPAMLCPYPDSLASSLFTWSPYSIAVLLVIGVAAPLRILAFRQLGQNFTFRLAKPVALVKTGLYGYVQHPSYSADWLVLTANMACLLRLDGVLGCMVPNWMMKCWILMAWPVLIYCFAMIGLCGIWIRVKDEETMLKAEFGQEWEEYHRKTKRFIPGIF